jgi:hypothetical protein
MSLRKTLHQTIFLALLAWLLAACNPNGYPDFMRPATSVAAVVRPTQTPARPTVAAAPAQLATPTQPPAPGEALNDAGPWLTYLADSTVGYQMLARNPDGSGQTVLGVFPELSGPIIARPVGAGSYFSLYNARNSTLTIFGLPRGGTLTSFSLLSHPDLTGAQKQLYAGILAQQNTPSQVWSPDGSLLAFIGAMDGGFTDLYIYNPLDASQNRLTGNIGESSFPIWSPDGSAVLVQELLMNPALGSYATQTVYYLSVDGVTLRTLYAPASQYEQIFGWIDPTTFVVASQRPAGFLEARRYMLEERKHSQLKFAGAMDLTAFSPEKAVLAFTAQPRDKNAEGLSAGLYWTSPNSGPVTVERGNWHRLTYLPAAGRFFAARSGAVLSFYPGLDPVTFLDEDNLPAAAPDGSQLAFWSAAGSASPGLRLYGQDGVPGRAITTLPVTEAVWTPDSSALFFVSRGDLYRVALPDGEPVLQGNSVSNLGWVGMR